MSNKLARKMVAYAGFNWLHSRSRYNEYKNISNIDPNVVELWNLVQLSDYALFRSLRLLLNE